MLNRPAALVATRPAMNITQMTAAELVRHYRVGALSPVEVTHAVLDQIGQANPHLNAFCLVDAEAALRSARASELRWQRAAPRSDLDGVPISVKDVLAVAGWPTRMGSRALPPAGPQLRDCPAVARVREAGCTLIGATTTSDLGWKAVTDSPLTGLTRNPLDPTRTPGGSSGGSAAAVAAGMGPLSIGTDGGGSVRIPAAFTGLVGFKPTRGRVPHLPGSAWVALSHVGPMARDVADVTALFQIISKADDRDWTALPTGPASPPAELRGLRVALATAMSEGDGVDPDGARSVVRAGAALNCLGAVVEQVTVDFPDTLAAFRTLWSCGLARCVAEVPAGRLDQLDPGMRPLIASGASRSARDYLDALEVQTLAGERTADFYQRYDVLLTPTTPFPAFPVAHDVPPGSGLADWMDWAYFSYPFNLTHQPAITIPYGLNSEQLPLGVQIVGPRHGDERVLTVAAALEAMAPPRQRWDPAPHGRARDTNEGGVDSP